ncbi:hypothetical protein D3C73_1424940 [compost metagenome]
MLLFHEQRHLKRGETRIKQQIKCKLLYGPMKEQARSFQIVAAAASHLYPSGNINHSVQRAKLHMIFRRKIPDRQIPLSPDLHIVGIACPSRSIGRGYIRNKQHQPVEFQFRGL